MVMKKMTKLVKQKIITRRIGIKVVIRDENTSVQGKWFE